MRLIDANELLHAMCKKCNEEYSDEPCEPCDCFIRGVIGREKTVDAVEVVRCKDCWKSAEGLCSYQLKNIPGKDFCGDGERKDNERKTDRVTKRVL